MRIKRSTAAFSPWDLKDLEGGRGRGADGVEVEEGSVNERVEREMQMQKEAKPGDGGGRKEKDNSDEDKSQISHTSSDTMQGPLERRLRADSLWKCRLLPEKSRGCTGTQSLNKQKETNIWSNGRSPILIKKKTRSVNPAAA